MVTNEVTCIFCGGSYNPKDQAAVAAHRNCKPGGDDQ